MSSSPRSNNVVSLDRLRLAVTRNKASAMRAALDDNVANSLDAAVRRDLLSDR